jgi:hypothetical protein
MPLAALAAIRLARGVGGPSRRGRLVLLAAAWKGRVYPVTLLKLPAFQVPRGPCQCGPAALGLPAALQGPWPPGPRGIRSGAQLSAASGALRLKAALYAGDALVEVELAGFIFEIVISSLLSRDSLRRPSDPEMPIEGEVRHSAEIY